MIKRVDALLYAILIDVFDHLDAKLLGCLITELDHFLEFPCRVDMQERKRWLLRIEGFHRQMEHYGAVFSDGIQHYRFLTLGCHFSYNVDCLCFECIKMG